MTEKIPKECPWCGHPNAERQIELVRAADDYILCLRQVVYARPLVRDRAKLRLDEFGQKWNTARIYGAGRNISVLPVPGLNDPTASPQAPDPAEESAK